MKTETKVLKRKDAKANVRNISEADVSLMTVTKKKNVTNSKFGPMPTFPNQRVWTRTILVLSIVTVVYFSSKNKKDIILAKQSDILPHRGQNIPCSDSYKSDLQKFEGCVPEKCGRFITDKLVTPTEANFLLKIAKKGLAFGGSDGGASILDLHSGALSKGKQFINIYSLDSVKNIFNKADLAIYKAVRYKIHNAVAQSFNIEQDTLFLTHPTFFSQLTDKPPATIHDEYWHSHIDKDTYKSFHYTSLLYLTDYGVDFEGGRFIFVESARNSTVEPRIGRVAMFTSGAENIHLVEKVTKGVRYALTVSFTCDPTYAIEDPSFNL